MPPFSGKDLPALSEIPCFALFEDEFAKHLVLFDELKEVLTAHSPAELSLNWALIEQACHEKGNWVVLAAAYEMGLALEPRLIPRLPPGAPLLRAWVFSRRTLVPASNNEAFWAQQLEGIPPQAKEAGLLGLKPLWNEEEYSKTVDKILGLIAGGDCYQVNLTMPITGLTYGSPLAIYARLRECQTVSQAALIRDQDEWILSRTPELFVERTGQSVSCRPMKGTSRRGLTPQQDLEFVETLRNSEKNRSENLMIVDLIRNDLGRLAAPGKVSTKALFEIETYETLHQMTSTVQAEDITAPARSVLETLFPCGSITGAPKIRSMEIIDELEPDPRGVYCGALGWLVPNGDFRFNVPIRTLFIGADGTCRLNVGGGIVADSTPDEEYRECLLKARFATALQDEVHLLETMLWQPGTGIPLLSLHLERLRSSAKALGFLCDTQAILTQLDATLKTYPSSPQRVRLQLWAQGEYKISVFPIENLPPFQTACIARERLDPRDPRLYHKTSARGFYNKALEQCMAKGHFDCIFLNIREELCEGARSNLFLKLKGEVLTPKIDSGLLPGVLRAHLIKTHKAREATLYLEDLMEAEEIWLGNALRGLVPIRIPDITLPSAPQFG